MAARASRHGKGDDAPIRIQAQYLREGHGRAPAGPLSGFAITLDDELPSPIDARRRAAWRQKDLERALGAAREAELSSYRVEIAPDGTISIVVGAPGEKAPVPAAA